MYSTGIVQFTIQQYIFSLMYFPDLKSKLINSLQHALEYICKK